MRNIPLIGKIVFSFLIFFLLNSCEYSFDLQKDDNKSFVVKADLAEKIANELDLDKLAGLNLKTQAERNIETIDVVYSDNGDTDFYIINFEEDNGFVIISADKRIMPILAYSNKGKFITENIKGGVSVWLKDNKSYLKRIRKGEVIPEENVDDLWNTFGSPGEPVPIEPGGPGGDPDDPGGGGGTTPTLVSTVSKGPFLLTQWGQGDGYNDYIPNNGLTGCASTAMAQVMRYYKHPSNYDWDSMDLNEGTNNTAYLMWYIGEKIGMTIYQYSPTFSWVTDEQIKVNMVSVFENDFDYSTTTRYVDYTGNYNMLINELNYNKPIIFKGLNSDDMGHIWVCDGYYKNVYTTFTTLYFHINWGWDGNFNGYFASNQFNPGSENFNRDLGCIIGIKP